MKYGRVVAETGEHLLACVPAEAEALDLRLLGGQVHRVAQWHEEHRGEQHDRRHQKGVRGTARSRVPARPARRAAGLAERAGDSGRRHVASPRIWVYGLETGPCDRCGGSQDPVVGEAWIEKRGYEKRGLSVRSAAADGE